MAIIVAAVATFLLGFDESLIVEGRDAGDGSQNSAEAAAASTIAANSLEPVKELKAYVTGEAIKIEEVGDGVFSEKMLGDGIATIPSDEVVVSPADGVICSMAESKHAVGIQLNNGVQLLIHIGLDTVSMNGTGFEVYVKEGDFVRCGQKLIGFDMDEIRKAGFKDTVMMIVVENEKDLSLDFTGYGMVKAGEDVLAKIK